MSKVVSIRLKEDQVERLQRMARQQQRKLSDMAAILLEEAMRQEQFAYIDFRNTPVGRMPYIKGTRLKVWHVAMYVDGLGPDAEKIAELLGRPPHFIQAALDYMAAYPDEIRQQREDNDRSFDEAMKRPGAEVFIVPSEASPRAKKRRAAAAS